VILKPSVLHVIKDLKPSSGGPTRSAPVLMDELFEEKINLSLVTFSRKGEAILLPMNSGIKSYIVGGFWDLMRSLNFLGKNKITLKYLLKNIDILHIHGLWSYQTSILAIISIMSDIKLVIHPRGMLSKSAINSKKYKKRLALLLYQRFILKRASLIYVTSRDEYNDVLEFSQSDKIIMVPNNGRRKLSKDFKSLNQNSNNTYNFLFISRLHPLKGLDNLLIAFKNLKQSNWHLTIAGPGSIKYLRKLHTTCKRFEISQNVTFLPEVNDEQKNLLYQKHDVFVLPSLTENYGIVVEEALFAQMPVITTTGTPWKDLNKLKCGWCVGTLPIDIYKALTEVINMDKQQLKKMGYRGRTYIEEKSKNRAAKIIAKDYRRLLIMVENKTRVE
jgi:glycosyltransferase involved in cell wall biosynthesis